MKKMTGSVKIAITRYMVLSIVLMLTVITESMAKTNTEKTGILLVSFGTSYAEAQVALDNIDEEVKKNFPEIEVRWAFTSNIIRRKLAKQGRHVDSPAEAIAKMGNDGFTKLAVQSLHIIPGVEYESLKKTVDAFNQIPKGVKQLALGKSLLYEHDNIKELCSKLERGFPTTRLDDAIVLMGHGTFHQSNIYYPGVQYYLWQLSTRYFMGTVEGYPNLDDVLFSLKKQKIKRIWLMPFMSVAGDHARNDMAGDDADSWKSILEAEGYEVKPLLKGLAEQDDIVNIWINHLKDALYELEN